MTGLQIRATIAGVFFGLWPLFMARSNLSGNAAAVAFSTMSTAVILPVLLVGGGWPTAAPNWYAILGAGLFGAFGLLVFNSAIVKATPAQMGALFVLNNVLQVAVGATFQAIATRSLPVEKGLGYLLAAASVFLLVR